MEASVRLHGNPIGTLSAQRAGGDLSFSYGEEYHQMLLRQPDRCHPISVSMSSGERSYGPDKANPFFAGLLPDNRNIRRALARYLQQDAGNDFALLTELGRECPGAISIVSPDSEIIPDDQVAPSYHLLSERELAEHIRDLPSRPLFIDADGELRLSLAGVHDKAAILIVDGQPALPKGRTPTSHILKVDIAGLDDSARVENFCLKLARRLGLNAVNSSIRMAEEIPYLLVSRYDRVVSVSGNRRRLIRLHQEDFCQALSKHPEEKYEKDNGPTWADLFSLSPLLARPSEYKNDLLARAVFQFLVGNPDAHAKNYALVFKAGSVSLSPLYDVNNAAAFADHYKVQRPRLAMSIGNERNPEALTPHHWSDFAEEIEMSAPLVHQVLYRMAERIIIDAQSLRDELRETPSDSFRLDNAVEDIVERANSVLSWKSDPSLTGLSF